MLISVFCGASRDTAEPLGNMHFLVAPEVDDKLEIDGFTRAVSALWHLPSVRSAGPKLAILVAPFQEAPEHAYKCDAAARPVFS